ncbi:hypothetical protein HGRIS_002908 [Hohenbuehelia grisea]|uniref:Glutathione transferase n=1 Tax=Hohenbuehelia grisea TaxID=104357 RepID=A0ABR3JLW5_9AGAR
MTLTLSSPLSLYSIPIVWILAYHPQVIKGNLIKKTIGYDNVNARTNVKRVADSDKVSREVVARVQRAEGAHLNGLEALPMWGLGILAGNFAGLDHWTLNVVSLAFILTRFTYNQVYINYNTLGKGFFRSLVWAAGSLMPLYLVVKAANKLAAQ